MTKQPITVRRSHVVKLVELLSHGLVAGLGEQKPGKMCVEAAVCCALGLPHGDNPPCVGESIRNFKIGLNDSSWSSNQTRAKGMARLAIAQLGSDELNQREFSRLLALRVTQKLLPDALIDYSQYCKPEYVEKHKEIANDCANARTNEDVKDSLDRLDSLASLVSLVRLDRLASLVSLVSLDRLDRLASLVSLVSLASLDSFSSLDKFLTSVSDVATEVLIEMKSPGCKWLDLVNV